MLLVKTGFSLIYEYNSWETGLYSIFWIIMRNYSDGCLQVIFNFPTFSFILIRRILLLEPYFSMKVVLVFQWFFMASQWLQPKILIHISFFVVNLIRNTFCFKQFFSEMKCQPVVVGNRTFFQLLK